jgi:hypothetical protein
MERKKIRSTDLDIEGVGILHVEENCQVFSESFLLLSTTSGYANLGEVTKLPLCPNLATCATLSRADISSEKDDEPRTDGVLYGILTRPCTATQHSP